MNVAIYARVSTKNQESEHQQHELIRYCAKQGYAYKLFVDEGVSAAKARPQFKQMKDRIKLMEFDMVIAYKLDRLSRRQREFFEFFHFCQDNKVKLHFLSQEFLNIEGPMGDLAKQILITFAELELNFISERTREKLHYLRDVKGIRLGRPEIINRDVVINLLNRNWSRNRIAKEINVTAAGLSRFMKRHDLQDLAWDRKANDTKGIQIEETKHGSEIIQQELLYA